MEIATPARSYFAGEKSDERQTRPLTEAEWLQELLLGVTEGRIDNVNC
jgi:hypothetical protein